MRRFYSEDPFSHSEIQDLKRTLISIKEQNVELKKDMEAIRLRLTFFYGSILAFFTLIGMTLYQFSRKRRNIVHSGHIFDTTGENPKVYKLKDNADIGEVFKVLAKRTEDIAKNKLPPNEVANSFKDDLKDFIDDTEEGAKDKQ
ncbi:hypothetical protein O9G_002530 [Rozella allomycis CSF55]|uniref:Uncharacterized protein n=1 Tax=Rozella allomycis (strain CSF55) TaxID=988480 RepID=A0A075AU74_ROZAC|nr:hypothetical protein O9G_002530 [Rozella allomycis CSF55]|eukprot:EPZ33818.1 hypothetical protein O9G_002530 [Rozella allomycis CSF55]